MASDGNGRPPCVDVAGRTCKRRACPWCGRTWARNWQTVTSSNLAAYDGPVALVSITAPGADLLPWACSRPHVHSGTKGCRVEEFAADEWALAARDNWRRLRDAARASVKRAGLPTGSLVLQRVWEPQKRGVPHLHVVVGLGSEPEKVAARRFVDELHRLAPEYFFGFVDRKLAPIGAREAARYLAGYLLGRSRKKGTVRENIADPRMPRSLIWLTPVLTRRTLVTMRRLRYARWYFAALSGRCSIYPELYGDNLLAVARVTVYLEKQRPNPPPIDDERAFQRACSLLRSMRRLMGSPAARPLDTVAA